MATTIGNIKSGQSGKAVEEIQKLLNQNGYSLSTDGIFGSQTAQAVRDYQQKNGLRVDGVVGNQTMSSLWSNATPQATTVQAPTNSNPTVSYLTNYGSRPTYTPSNTSAPTYTPSYGSAPVYNQSQAVIDAAQKLTQADASKPGAFQSGYAAQIENMLSKIMNREKFSYDFASDPMYQQYAEQYQRKGKMAMLDTMGNAAALSGGYGNSYAQTAGQQAYQGYLGQLNNVIPELRDAAYSLYQNEGQDMYNQMGMLQGLENTEYGRHRDAVNDWQNDRNYLADRYDTAYNQDYNAHRDAVADYENNRAFDYNAYRNQVADYQDARNFDYNAYRDSVADYESDRDFNYGASQDALSQNNWEKQFAYQQTQDAQGQSNWEKEFALAAEKAKGGGSSGKSSTGGTSGSSKSEDIGNVGDSSYYNSAKDTVVRKTSAVGADKAMQWLDYMVNVGNLNVAEGMALAELIEANSR